MGTPGKFLTNSLICNADSSGCKSYLADLITVPRFCISHSRLLLDRLRLSAALLAILLNDIGRSGIKNVREKIKLTLRLMVHDLYSGQNLTDLPVNYFVIGH